MGNIKWIFDGFGTEILSLIIGLATGGAIGYKVGIRNKIKQKQNRTTSHNIPKFCMFMNITLFK